jgi:hypothetical protein
MKLTNNEPIILVCATDDNYAMPLAVTVLLETMLVEVDS